ncbi:hypothetical protein BHM03_00062845 [Ensete ventricosum]|nr:hypothetical protein BHM03_00062845 [Ensete ventricosum]
MSRSPPSLLGGGGSEGEDGEEAVSLGSRRNGDTSLSRPRPADVVWPEHFVEAVAAHVAVDAASSDGPLAAAPAVVAVLVTVVGGVWWHSVLSTLASYCASPRPIPIAATLFTYVKPQKETKTKAQPLGRAAEGDAAALNIRACLLSRI